ncbi:hypothetical protein M2454_002649 [Aequitasia blattaphilus]|uniref:Uncharacterized protein n=1 Tax=Aequitasia blattaphilus TaxID=2949332 RepID=A0ABT1EBN3_9FIRM|nr:hypothetical protein [Aequitasia blattaphilus]MCP1103243.1 hypothetical protein [Aequitasia blattaphilus]MCR8615883.1 hypothetical protein [Aequitasia blattaphilus]
MKRFIYLDTEVLNSYIAQLNDGLIKQTEKEVGSQEKKETSSTHNIGAEGQLSAKVLGKGLDGKLKYSYEQLKDIENVDLIRDVQTKIVHDNAFEELVEYLKNNNLLSEETRNVGGFIEIKDEFFILDLEYYKKVFCDGDFVNYFLKTKEEELRNKLEAEADENLNREQKRGKSNEIKNLINQQVEEMRKEYTDVGDIIKALMSILPYKRMMCINDLLVVMDDKYCRDEIEMMAFKYSGEAKILGYITNILEDDKNNGVSVFASVNKQMNAILKVLLDHPDKLYVVHPVAIYYE